MRLSIIIACLNAESVLGHCLDSVLAQDYEDVEVVVADGGSRDGTLDILRRYAQTMGRRLTWLSEKDRGIGDAWNKAIRHASGEWLLFLGADDALAAPDVVGSIVPILGKALPDHEIVCGRVAMVRNDGQFVCYFDPGWSPVQFRRCRVNWSQQSVFHHRSVFDKYGDFDATLRFLSDYDLLLRALKEKEPLQLSQFTVATMRIGGLSNNRRFAAALIREQLALFKRHVGGAPLVLSWWLVKASGITLLSRLGGDRLALSVINVYRKLVGGRDPLPY